MSVAVNCNTNCGNRKNQFLKGKGECVSVSCVVIFNLKMTIFLSSIRMATSTSVALCHIILVFQILLGSSKMHSLKVHKVISGMISLFYRIGFWHRGGEITARELKIKLFYCVYYFLFVISLVVGARTSDNDEDRIFLAEVSVAIAVLCFKLWVLIWKQKQILELLKRICTFSIRDDDDFTFVNKKLRNFTKFVIGLSVGVIFIGVCNLAIPFIGSERTFLPKMAFPLDWKNNGFSFWVAFIFLFTEIVLSLAAFLFSIIIWYLMLNCSIRYEVLGSELRKLGGAKKTKISNLEKRNIFLQDLKASIDAHLHTTEAINELESFCSTLFFIQIGTSGLCICGSTYCLAFDVSDNLMVLVIHALTLFYNISEIFMISLFGNDILVSSNRLSYNLYESDWMDQPRSTAKWILIFGEYLKQPHQLVIGKLYPLTLDTFTRILKSVYSMFNILKNAEQ